MPDIETSIVDISEDALNELFDETPEKTVNADTLLGGKKQDSSAEEANSNSDNPDESQEDSEEDLSKKSKKKSALRTKVSVPEKAIEDFNIDDLDDESEEDEDKEEEEAKKKVTDKDKKPDDSKEKSDEENAPDVKALLKSTVEYLIRSGVWEDFDGREELDIDEETYAKLAVEQDKRRVQGMFEELVDSTGIFGKAIIDYVKNGGNPDEIIDLFKEQKQIDSINIEDIDGQKEIIKHYFTEVMGWKQEKVDKYISNRVISNELESEAQEVKELLGSYYKKEADRLNSERAEDLKKQQIAEQAFESNIRNAIKERKDLSPTEKKAIEMQVLTYDQRLPNGNLVNKFYVDFMKMQSNPQDYVDLIMFVTDKQKYNQKIATKEKSEATAKAFNFIKGNGALSSKKGSGYDQAKKSEKISSFDWGISRK